MQLFWRWGMWEATCSLTSILGVARKGLWRQSQVKNGKRFMSLFVKEEKNRGKIFFSNIIRNKD